MTSKRNLVRALIAGTAAASLLAACSSGGGGTAESQAPGTESQAPATSAASGTMVAVKVGETDVAHQYMTLDTATVPAGAVTFTVTNEGVKKHEFVVLSSDTPAGGLTIDGDEVVEDDYAAVDEIGDLPAGETATLTVDLQPGHYDLICNIKGHYRMGMKTDFTVT